MKNRRNMLANLQNGANLALKIKVSIVGRIDLHRGFGSFNGAKTIAAPYKSPVLRKKFDDSDGVIIRTVTLYADCDCLVIHGMQPDRCCEQFQRPACPDRPGAFRSLHRGWSE